MRYTDWLKPRPFQDDPGFLGRKFADQIREHGIEKVMCLLATDTWSSGVRAHSRSINNSQQAIFDTPEPYMGKRNVLYRLRMPDSTLWMARLHNSLVQKSAVVDETERVANERMLQESEIATMVFVKRNTQIPVPEIYGYNSTSSNPLGTPYIFIEYIPGKPFPFPFSENRTIREYELVMIHLQLMHFVRQLCKHPFNKIGQLQFASDKGTDVVVGPIVDRKNRRYGPFENSKDFYVKRAKTVLEYEVFAERTLQTAGFKSKHSSDSVESAALHMKAAAYASIESFTSGPFILQHLDLHWQNLLMDENCIVVGVIDWEWAQTVPVESLQLLPFNFVSKMLPFQPTNVQRHEKIAARFLQILTAVEEVGLKRQMIDEIVSLQDSPQKQICQCLHSYNWPEVRRTQFERLKELIEEVKASQLAEG